MPLILDGSTGVTFPAGGVGNPASAVVGLTDTQTLTNKSVVATQLTGTVAAARLPAGAVLQVVSAATTTSTSTTSSSYVAVTNLTASITPSSATSKILILVNANIYNSASGGSENAMTIYKDGADLTGGNGFSDSYTGLSDLIAQAPMMYLDSPATTSSKTYAIYIKKTQGTGTVQVNLRGTTSTITLMEIAA